MISKRTIPDLSAWHQAHGTQHQLRISSSCTRPVNRVCAQAKDVGSSSQGYLVQKGDTLFEISQTSGVSMKQLRELNPQLEFKAVLLEGQKLTLPVIATSTDNPSAPAQQQAACSTSAPASGGSASGKAPGLLWAGSQHVHTINVEEAQQLYDSMYELTNTHDTILVVYAPWCKYCKNMEAQVERLAQGLAHQRSFRVVALNGDPPEARLFAKQVLNANYFPTIIALPRRSRTFYSFKRSSPADAKALLRFVNMTCRAHDESLYTLSEAATTSSSTLLSPAPATAASGSMPLLIGMGAALVAAAAYYVVAGKKGLPWMSEAGSTTPAASSPQRSVGEGTEATATSTEPPVRALPPAPSAAPTQSPAEVASSMNALEGHDESQGQQTMQTPDINARALAAAVSPPASVHALEASAAADSAPMPLRAAPPDADSATPTASERLILPANQGSVPPPEASPESSNESTRIAGASKPGVQLPAALSKLSDEDLIALVANEPDIDRLLDKLMAMEDMTNAQQQQQEQQQQ